MTRMPNIITTNIEETVMSFKKVVEHEIDSLPVVKCFLDAEGDENLRWSAKSLN